MAYLGIDNTDVDTSNEFEIVPEGEYKLFISEADMIPGSLDGNKRLTLTISIAEGEYKDKYILDGLNIIYSNPDEKKPGTTQKIGRQNMARLQDAMGVSRKANDTKDLLNHIFYGWFDIVPPTVGKDGKPYKARNALDFTKLKPASAARVSTPSYPPTAGVASPVYVTSNQVNHTLANDEIPF